GLLLHRFLRGFFLFVRVVLEIVIEVLVVDEFKVGIVEVIVVVVRHARVTWLAGRLQSRKNRPRTKAAHPTAGGCGRRVRVQPLGSAGRGASWRAKSPPGSATFGGHFRQPFRRSGNGDTTAQKPISIPRGRKLVNGPADSPMCCF